MAPNIAFNRIAALLQARMRQQALTTREAARLIGLTHTTLIRALKSNSMDLPTVFIALFFSKCLTEPKKILGNQEEPYYQKHVANAKKGSNHI